MSFHSHRPTCAYHGQGPDFKALSNGLQVSVFHLVLDFVLNILYRRSIADVFRIQVVSNSDVRSPIITLGSTSFFHVRINNLYVVAVTKCVGSSMRTNAL